MAIYCVTVAIYVDAEDAEAAMECVDAGFNLDMKYCLHFRHTAPTTPAEFATMEEVITVVGEDDILDHIGADPEVGREVNQKEL